MKKGKKIFVAIATVLTGCTLMTACSSKESTNTSTQIDSATKSTLEDFGDKFLNYKSVDERNESIKDLMTEKAQNDNGINTKTSADFQAKGEVKQIYQDISNKNQYLIFGNYQVQLENTNVVLRVTMKNGKIDKLTVDYTRQAY